MNYDVGDIVRMDFGKRELATLVQVLKPFTLGEFRTWQREVMFFPITSLVDRGYVRRVVAKVLEVR